MLRHSRGLARGVRPRVKASSRKPRAVRSADGSSSSGGGKRRRQHLGEALERVRLGEEAARDLPLSPSPRLSDARSDSSGARQAYYAKWEALLRMEWECEEAATNQRLLEWPVEKLEKEGLCLAGLSARRRKGRFYSQPILRLSLRRSGLKHSFQPGDEVLARLQEESRKCLGRVWQVCGKCLGPPLARLPAAGRRCQPQGRGPRAARRTHRRRAVRRRRLASRRRREGDVEARPRRQPNRLCKVIDYLIIN